MLVPPSCPGVRRLSSVLDLFDSSPLRIAFLLIVLSSQAAVGADRSSLSAHNSLEKRRAVLTPAAACAGASQMLFEVVGRHEPVALKTDFSVAQIESREKRRGFEGKHKAVGFYLANVGYSIEVDIRNAKSRPCKGPVLITVFLVLTDRAIQIGWELEKNSCLFSAAAAHYSRHASMDEHILTAFIRLAKQGLSQASWPRLQRDTSLLDAERERLKDFAHTIIERRIPLLKRARDSAWEIVDTPEEVDGFTEACTSHT